MANVRLPLLAATLMIAGCLGEVPTGNGGQSGVDAGSGADPAEMAWTTNILPIVTSTTHNCNSGTCHGPPSGQLPRLTSFAELKSMAVPPGKYVKKPWEMNILFTKIITLGTPPMHSALPYLSDDEQATFKTFIDTYGTP